jgi:hypothetical protein
MSREDLLVEPVGTYKPPPKPAGHEHIETQNYFSNRHNVIRLLTRRLSLLNELPID